MGPRDPGWKQRLELYSYEPRNTKDDRKPSKAKHGKDSPSEGTNPDLRLLASRTTREYISIVLSHQVLGNFLWQPQETNTLSTPDPGRAGVKYQGPLCR